MRGPRRSSRPAATPRMRCPQPVLVHLDPRPAPPPAEPGFPPGEGVAELRPRPPALAYRAQGHRDGAGAGRGDRNPTAQGRRSGPGHETRDLGLALLALSPAPTLPPCRRQPRDRLQATACSTGVTLPELASPPLPPRAPEWGRRFGCSPRFETTSPPIHTPDRSARPSRHIEPRIYHLRPSRTDIPRSR